MRSMLFAGTALAIFAGIAAAGSPTILVSANDQLFRYNGGGGVDQFTLSDDIVGLSNLSNGTILAVSRNAAPAGGEAYTLDDAFGTPTLSLLNGNIQPIAGPTYAEANGTLYTVQAGDLYSVDSMFNRTLVGSLGLAGSAGFIGGASYDAASDTFYASSQDGNLYTLDLGTGAASLVGAFGVAADNSGLEFFNGVLYAALQSDNDLVTRVGTVDLVSGAFSELNSIDLASIGTGPTAITVIIPAPGGFGVLALAGVAAIRRRR